MKKIVLKTITFIMLLAITGCNDWLEVSPKTDMKAEDLFKNEAGFRDALTGVYALLCRGNSYARDLTYGWLDVLAQYYDSPRKVNASGYDHNFKQAALFNYLDESEEGRILSIWSNHYTAIANINLALQYIDGRKDVFTVEAVYRVYKGELLGLRAMLHFNILRLFASSAAMEGGSGLEKPAIPYLETYTNQAQPQLTGREVLSLVKRDLTDAKKLMKEYDVFDVTDTNNPLYRREIKMNYYAVTTLLARMCLYAGEKTEALAQAKEVIGEADGEIPTHYRLAEGVSSSADPMFTSELIFMLDVQKLKDMSDIYFLESFASTANILTMSQSGYKNVFNSSELENDFRLPWLTGYSDGMSSVLTKFNGIKYVPMFKISELYLIAAESAGETEGKAYLNKLRNHRGLAIMAAHTSFQEYLMQEYRREFIGEGQLFFFYKRKVMDRIGAEDNIGIENLLQVYNLPIPQSEIDFGNIKQ